MDLGWIKVKHFVLRIKVRQVVTRMDLGWIKVKHFVLRMDRDWPFCS